MDKRKVVLVIPYRGIGDLIFHIPLIRGLYKKYKSKIIIITNSANKAKFILHRETTIKKIEYINFERKDQIKNSFNFLKKVNEFKADISILTTPSKRLVIPFLMSNAKKKIFFRKNKIRDLSKYIISQSIKEFPNINFLKKYNLIHKEKKIKDHKIFLSIDSHHDQNNWNEDNFISLTTELLKINKIKKIFINFSPTKIKRFSKISKNFFRNKKIFFTYNKKFDKIIDIIQNCSSIIGNESGPACLGASYGKNVFSIYNPSYTPNLSSKIINKRIIYFNSAKLKSKTIIKEIIKNVV